MSSLLPHIANGLYPLPLLLQGLDFLVSYFADGLYPAENIEAALKQAFGANRSILDCSHLTSTGTQVGLPVATVDDKPSCRIFANYNGVGERKGSNNQVVKPKDGLGKVLLWEIARAASAAPGFFPPKHIRGIGTFQDAGPLKNDPLISALSEVAAIFPSVEEPDFVVSLGTGEPMPRTNSPTRISQNIWKNGAFPRLCRLFWEKMRDKKVRKAFQGHPRYHRLDLQFDESEPKLDDIQSIAEVKLKAQEDKSVCEKIAEIARCMIASLFYFELDSIPQRLEGKYVGTGHILCSIRRNDPAFQPLLDLLLFTSAQFWINGCLVGNVVNDSCFDGGGNFRKRIEISTDDKFAITIKRGSSTPCIISGSPFLVSNFISLQGLDAVFGSPDHGKRKWSSGEAYERKKQRL